MVGCERGKREQHNNTVLDNNMKDNRKRERQTDRPARPLPPFMGATSSHRSWELRAPTKYGKTSLPRKTNKTHMVLSLTGHNNLFYYYRYPPLLLFFRTHTHTHRHTCRVSTYDDDDDDVMCTIKASKQERGLTKIYALLAFFD